MKTRDEVLGLYRERLSERGRESERRRKRLTLLSFARLGVFAAGVALLWLVWEVDRGLWPWLALPFGLFACLLFVYARLRSRLRRTERAEDFYRRGIARLEDRWSGTGKTGERFLDRQHPYARDLDIFGRGSLYELLATTVSPWGSKALAEWLMGPASPGIVRARQDAIREVRPLLELREALASEADERTEGLDPEALRSWATAAPVLTPGFARWIALALGIATASLVVLWLASVSSRALAFAAIMAAASFAAFYRPRARVVLASVEAPAAQLQILASLLERLERESFSSPLLAALQGSLAAEGLPASRQIRRLVRLIELLDARRNMLFAPLAALLLWGTQFAFGLEAWRLRAGSAVPLWLKAVSELDALLALSGHSFENPDDPFPEIREGEARFEARELGHPLIPGDRLVRNDVAMGGELRLLVVSGSNMSGKSTLLRAIGVNAVLALAGAPVRARALSLSPTQVAAAIRVEDSLQDGISHFYAEILRLRQVMELASRGATEAPVLFLLDEILHGTNSHDRRIGAEAVVRGLLERGAFGLITTHDLALSKLTETLPGRARNVHFEDQIEEGKVRFDYRMRDGVVTKSNALELMRSIGLEV
jgi:hypothetical protein